ncbi:carboxy terminal-processing peptidase [Ruficoccus amylovorans]|uniref:Carboxy terminal-processing peptidase n=1 Tax=Ruficoccus amylovorans TaxID=1804625 RepID=A0A842HB54_9BACT|nr:carboxy terminal-processing peptidase [Ruficoccus amylovorans]MBC2593703.1 carboxy terminal-processing peptidase [Ruficoccus amylovorans]
MKFARSISLALFVFLAGGALAQAEKLNSAPFETTGTMREETRYLIQCLETQHYLNQPLSKLDSEGFIKSYIQDLDPQHLFFLQSEINDYEARFGPSLYLFLERGRLYPAFVIFEDYRDRVIARAAWVQERLQQDFNFTSESTYAPDRSKTEWPATEAEANALWEKRIEYQVLDQILSEIDNDEVAVDEAVKEKVDATAAAEVVVAAEEVVVPEITPEMLTEARDVIRKQYERMEKSVTELEASDVQEIFLTALTHMYDPHSTYFSANSLEEFSIAMRNSLVGIGAVLQDNEGYCTIKELLPGGPAERSRELDPEDRILAVAQGKDGEFVDVVGMKLTKIVKLIRGKEGTLVRLLVRPAKGDPSDRKTVNLVRDEIKLTANLASAEVFDVPAGNTTVPIGVIELPAFYGSGDPSSDEPSTTGDVEELIGKLKDMGVKGLVLDLRRNGGGLLTEAIGLTGLFIPDGPVVQVRDIMGQVQGRVDDNGMVAWDGPLIVLVSRFSASASEIVAGALKNHNRAIIVGDEETHGKGTVQAIFEMNRSNFLSSVKPRRGAAKVTVQKYYLPDGTSTQIKGVRSDIVLPSANMLLPIGEDDLPNAMAWDSIPGMEWSYSIDFTPEGEPISPALLDDLRQRSMDRQGALEEFTYLNDNIDWVKKRREQKDYSLNLSERLALRKEDELFQQKMKKGLRELASLNFPSESVLLKVTEEQNAEHEAYLAEIAERDAQEAAQAESTPAKGAEKAAEPLNDAAPKTVDAGDASETPAVAEFNPKSKLEIESLESAAKTVYTPKETFDPDAQVKEDVEVQVFKTKDGESETVRVEVDEEEDLPDFDIHLREALRIMADWVEMSEQAAPSAPLAANATKDKNG